MCGMMTSLTFANSFLTVMVILQSAAFALRSTSMEQLFNSSCSHQMKSMSEKDVQTLETLVPPHSFIDMLQLCMVNRPHTAVLLLEVDKASHLLAINHIKGLRLSNSTAVPFVVAYDAGVCEKLRAHVNVGCYFDNHWIEQLHSFHASTKDTLRYRNSERAMLGRMMTTIFTLCAGYNVFLSDSDIVYYRDPMDYVMRDADVMITSTFMDPHEHHREIWGGYFYANRPKDFSTMNNGVVFFRSTGVVRNLHLTMAVEGIRTLLAEGDNILHGFLQIYFNVYMVKHKLSLNPCSVQSDPMRKKFIAQRLVLGGNRAGECYDCYYGGLNWTSKVVLAPRSAPTTAMPLHMGVFPMERFVSHCNHPEVTDLKYVTASGTAALRAGDRTGWGWGEDNFAARAGSTNATAPARALHRVGRSSYLYAMKTRPLSVHVNCIAGGSHTAESFVNKELVLKGIDCWFL